MNESKKIFHCDCGENYHYEGSDIGGGCMPCSCQRVGEMDFMKMVEYAGDTFGTMPFIKYDIYRETNKWTICMGNIRIGDTDNPKGLLYNWIKECWKRDA